VTYLQGYDDNGNSTGVIGGLKDGGT